MAVVDMNPAAALVGRERQPGFCVRLGRRGGNESFANDPAHGLGQPVDVDSLERVAPWKLPLLLGIIETERMLPKRFCIIQKIVDHEEGRVHRAKSYADADWKAMSEEKRIELSTGVTLKVAIAGDPAKPPVILLHGFPESHRTWREIVPRLEDEFFLVAPDQRGFAGSDHPQSVEAYRTDRLIDDIFALGRALGLERFALVGHDWGGAIAWAAALRGDPRLTRLSIINSPHPLVFQKSLIENEEQRAASQYITAFRNSGFDKMVEAKGFDWFFDTSFSRHLDGSQISEAERLQYIADWSQPGAFNAMLNWYRASKVMVPPPGLAVPLPDWLLRAFPSVRIPTQVIWGMEDKALLPLQLEGLSALVDDLAIVRLPGVGHFAPWQAGEQVASALRPFLGGDAAASASGQ